MITAVQLGIPMAQYRAARRSAADGCPDRYSKLEGFARNRRCSPHGTDAYVSERIELMKSITASTAPATIASPTSPEDPRSRLPGTSRRVLGGHELCAGQTGVLDRYLRRADLARLADRPLPPQGMRLRRVASCMIVGHVGDGNFHVLIAFDLIAATKQQRTRWRLIASHTSRSAWVAMCGRNTALASTSSTRSSRAWRGRRRDAPRSKALDPNNIMNRARRYRCNSALRVARAVRSAEVTRCPCVANAA